MMMMSMLTFQFAVLVVYMSTLCLFEFFGRGDDGNFVVEIGEFYEIYGFCWSWG